MPELSTSAGFNTYSLRGSRNKKQSRLHVKLGLQYCALTVRYKIALTSSQVSTMSEEFSPTKAGIKKFRNRMEGFSVIFDSEKDVIGFMQQLFADFQKDQQRASKPSGK